MSFTEYPVWVVKHLPYGYRAPAAGSCYSGPPSPVIRLNRLSGGAEVRLIILLVTKKLNVPFKGNTQENKSDKDIDY